MSVSHHIGLEIAQGCFRLVELQRQDHHTVVLRADIRETSLDYASQSLFDLPFDRDLAKTFISELVGMLTSSTFYAAGVSIVLPSLLPLVATLPYDAGLGENERQSQLEWECRTLLGLPAETRLSVLSHPLRGVDGPASSLVVALPRSVVDFLQTTFSHLTLNLESIDIDHFVMENSVKRQYPKDASGNYAVLGLFESHCSAGVYAGQQYKGFRMSAVTYKQQYTAQVLRLIERISREKLDNLYCFGPGFDTQVSDALRSLLSANVMRCLTTMDSDAELRFQEATAAQEMNSFDAAAAAALQGLG